MKDVIDFPDLKQENAARLAAIAGQERLKAGGGDGTSGGMSDDWKESVDRQLGHLHQDVRNLLTGLIAGFLFLIGGGVAAYLLADGKSDSRFEKTGERTGKIEDRLGAIERKADVIDMKLDLLLDRKGTGKR